MRFIIAAVIVYSVLVPVAWLITIHTLEGIRIEIQHIKATETQHHTYDVTVQSGASVVLPQDTINHPKDVR